MWRGQRRQGRAERTLGFFFFFWLSCCSCSCALCVGWVGGWVGLGVDGVGWKSAMRARGCDGNEMGRQAARALSVDHVPHTTPTTAQHHHDKEEELLLLLLLLLVLVVAFAWSLCCTCARGCVACLPPREYLPIYLPIHLTHRQQQHNEHAPRRTATTTSSRRRSSTSARDRGGARAGRRRRRGRPSSSSPTNAKRTKGGGGGGRMGMGLPHRRGPLLAARHGHHLAGLPGGLCTGPTRGT